MIKEIYMPFKGYKTYIRIVGSEYKKTPLILLHGGPGSTHNSEELLDDMSIKDKRPLIMYDQLGCGLSPCDDIELLKPSVWIEELETIVKYLNLAKYHLLGHSWGGMLLIMYLCDKERDDCISAILSSTLSSAKLWAKESKQFIRQLSKEDRKIIKDTEKSGNYDSKEYKEVLDRYYKICVFDRPVENSPECLRRVKPKTLSYDVWGKSEFHPTGELKNYEYTDKLKYIKVPTLILSGEKDESTPKQNNLMYRKIKAYKEQYIFKGSRHMTYYESHDLYEEKVINFLNKVDE